MVQSPRLVAVCRIQAANVPDSRLTMARRVRVPHMSRRDPHVPDGSVGGEAWRKNPLDVGL